MGTPRSGNSSELSGTYLLTAALGVGWALAVSFLVLMGEVIKVAVAGARDATKDVEQTVGGVVRSVAGRGQKP